MGHFAFVSLSWLILAVSLSGAGAQNSCLENWFRYNEFCYKVFNKFKSWKNAERFCMDQQAGCHLASIHSEAESFRLSEYISQSVKIMNVWIGLRDPFEQRNWQWSDGSKSSYTAWNQGEPNNFWNMNENCVELWQQSRYLKWNDEKCTSWRPFLCKCPLESQSEGST
uniref:Lectin-Boa-1 n=1 Tax=Boa constrictor TaxID=8574 RepID=M9T5Q1_BOACO